jgi:DNA repair protein RadD
MTQLTLLKPSPVVAPPALRAEQIEAKRELYRQIKEGYKRLLLVAPCAFGKTFLISSIIYDATVVKSRKVLIVVPFVCLVEQTAKTFDKFGIQYGILAGGHSESRDKPVQVATIQTISLRKIQWFDYDLLILDEAHILAFSTWIKNNFPMLYNNREVLTLDDLIHEIQTLELYGRPSWEKIKHRYAEIKEDCSAKQKTAYDTIRKYSSVFTAPKTPNQKIVIGLTGSPFRLSKKEFMADWFENQVLAPTPKEMIKRGLLTPCIYYGIKGANLESVHTGSDGDYIQRELEVACTDPEVIRSAVDNYLKKCPDRRFIAFAVTIAHARALTEEFTRRGVKAAIVTGDMPNKDRRPIYEALGKGEIQGCVSVGCLAVGFDVPEVSCVLLCRPTKSRALYIQQVGRGQRLAKHIGKENCIVLDQSGNVKSFGFIEMLEYPPLGDNSFKSKLAPTKVCPECSAICSQFESVCPQCGTTFNDGENEKKNEKIKPVGNLELLLPPSDRPVFKTFQKLLKEAYNRGYSPDYATMKCREDHGRFPPKEWARGAIFGKAPTEQDKSNYLNRLKHIARTKHTKQLELIATEKKQKTTKYDDKWINRHYFNEFGEKVNGQ